MNGAPDEMPDGPIGLVVGFTPGGASDRLARAVAPAVAERLGRAVGVDNRPGGAGNPAARHVAHAPADGRTLLLGNNGLLAANPLLFEDIGYEPLADFVPISLIGVQPSILVVTPRLAATTLDDLIRLGRSAPERLSMAVSGYGSAAHLAGELFQARTHLAFREKSYDGARPALDDLAISEVDVMFATASSVLGQIARGEARPLAVTAAKRTERLQDVPTMAELGFADFDVTSWHGLAAPAGTPVPVVAWLNSAVTGALDDAEVRAALDELAIDVVGNTPDAFASHIAAEVPKWAAMLAASGTSVRRRA